MNDIQKKVVESITEREIVTLLQELIACNSSYPPGNTIEVAKLCSNKLSENGIENKIFYPPENIKSALGDTFENRMYQSVVGEIKGEGPTLLLNAHIDTVPVGDLSNWSVDPFSGKIIDGKIYGRGAGDDKGSAAAQMMAAIAIMRSGYKLKGTLLLSLVADEEASSNRGTRWLMEDGIIKADYMIVGEQTDNILCLGERSLFWLRIIIKGKSAHGAMPWQGNNAVIHMGNIICRINNELVPMYQARKHKYITSTSIATTKIQGGIKVNIIPEYCSLELDCRVSAVDTKESVMADLKKLLDDDSQNGTKYKWEIEVLQDDGIPILTSDTHPIVKAFSGAAKDITGKETVLGGYKQASDGRVFSKEGIPIILFGPGDPAYGHSPDEFIPVSQLVEAAKIYALAIMRILS